MESITKKIYKIMKSKPHGYAFIYDDFINLGKYNAIRQSFYRLEKEGKIKKIIAGMYYIPHYIKVINKYSIPSIYDVVDALKRKFGWRITADDETILNKTNLSNQVTAKCIFNTSGPNKKYKIFNRMLILQHHDDTDTCLMSKKSALIVNSIKIIGKNNISKEKIKTLHNFLNANERKKLIKESKHLPNWIKIIIEEICK